MSTAGDILSAVWDVQYRRGYHDKCGDILSTVGGGVQYRGEILSTVADFQYRRGIS